MRHPIAILAAAALILFIGTREVSAQEEAVSRKQIPKAVMDALLAKFPKARIDKCTKAREGDDIVYDIEFKEKVRKCEADITEKGIFINFERAIKAKELPVPIRDAIEKRYPKAVLKEIMEETEVEGKDETLAAYEVVLLTANKKEVEVKVSPEGNLLEDTGSEKPGKKP